MRKSDLFLLFSSVCTLLLIATAVDSSNKASDLSSQTASRRMVLEHGLTDLALFTDARYTRHVSQSDLHSPFQDHPMSLEHYPSGSLLLPPEGVRR